MSDNRYQKLIALQQAVMDEHALVSAIPELPKNKSYEGVERSMDELVNYALTHFERPSQLDPIRRADLKKKIGGNAIDIPDMMSEDVLKQLEESFILYGVLRYLHARKRVTLMKWTYPSSETFSDEYRSLIMGWE